MESDQKNYTKRRHAWVKALRDGTFEQGTSVLRTVDDKFCCLGVACELASNKVGTKFRKLSPEAPYIGDDDISGIDTGYAFGNKACGLPDNVAEYYGMYDDEGKFSWAQLDPEIKERIKPYYDPAHSDNHVYLTTLNDRGVPFDLLADIIESEPNGLFY